MQTQVEELVEEIMTRLYETRPFVLCLDREEESYIRHTLGEWVTELLEEYGDGD